MDLATAPLTNAMIITNAFFLFFISRIQVSSRDYSWFATSMFRSLPSEIYFKALSPFVACLLKAKAMTVQLLEVFGELSKGGFNSWHLRLEWWAYLLWFRLSCTLLSMRPLLEFVLLSVLFLLGKLTYKCYWFESSVSKNISITAIIS